jgi:predicted transglutaminase-like cysteine proteinase
MNWCTRQLAIVLISAALPLACATPQPAIRFDFFAPADPRDPWFAKVGAWQRHAQQELAAAEANGGADDQLSSPPASSAPPELSGSLGTKMGAFEAEEKQQLARRINAWAQQQARQHYRFEDDVQDAALDQWPTFGQLLSRNGDDCDGLDLITYQLLLEFGFPRDEIYRSVVRRDRDGANHMVTLWFESRRDPWVLDATGAMTLEMVRFSELLGWTPTKVFNERQQFAVEQHGLPIALVRE